MWLFHLAKDNAANMQPLSGLSTTHNALAIFQQRFTWDDFLALRETGERLVAACADIRIATNQVATCERTATDG